jgi:hypothetical protein
MQIKITTESPDTLNREGLALGLFMDERPPRGACGLVDWRLNGLISREIAQGHISASFMEKTLIASPSRIPVSKILLLGLGTLSEITYDRLYLTGYLLAETMDGLLCKDFAFNLPTAGQCHLTVAGTTESMIRGCFDFLSKDIEKWANATIRILAHESYLEEVITGLQSFKRNTRDVSIVEIEYLNKSS